MLTLKMTANALNLLSLVLLNNINVYFKKVVPEEPPFLCL